MTDLDGLRVKLPNTQRITNKKDPLPILPGKFLGYQHTNGEKHIVDDENPVW